MMRCSLCVGKGGKYVPCRACGRVAGALPVSVAPERAIPTLVPGTLTPMPGEQTAASLGTVARVGGSGRGRLGARRG